MSCSSIMISVAVCLFESYLIYPIRHARPTLSNKTPQCDHLFNRPTLTNSFSVKELGDIENKGTPPGISLLSADSMEEWIFTIAVLGDETIYKAGSNM